MLKKILVVDDDKGWRDIFLHYLQIAGYEVVVEMNAEEALKDLQQGEFSLLLTDFNLGYLETDGVELAKKVRELFPLMPVILVSSRHDIKKIAQQNGFTDYHEKSIPFRLLIEKVDKILSSSDAQTSVP